MIQTEACAYVSQGAWPILVVVWQLLTHCPKSTCNRSSSLTCLLVLREPVWEHALSFDCIISLEQRQAHTQTLTQTVWAAVFDVSE